MRFLGFDRWRRDTEGGVDQGREKLASETPGLGVLCSDW